MVHRNVGNIKGRIHFMNLLNVQYSINLGIDQKMREAEVNILVHSCMLQLDVCMLFFRFSFFRVKKENNVLQVLEVIWAFDL